VTQHVVIVDDDDLTLKLFSGIAAEIEGVVVHPFLSSSEAIDWYRGKQVDLFCFDYNMPPPNGMQMIALVRALPEFALVPIVIVTGAHEREVRYQALDLGANDFLQKPVDRREMLARFTTLLALQAAQKRLAMQIGELEQSLLDSEERSRHHAERLEALWQVANNPNLHDDDLMLAMLQNCAVAIRPACSDASRTERTCASSRRPPAPGMKIRRRHRASARWSRSRTRSSVQRSKPGAERTPTRTFRPPISPPTSCARAVGAR
jgi:DNA-binding response OmpR family regulator